MTKYTFIELLHIYFRFMQDIDEPTTQDDLAQRIGVARRTLAGWFAGEYVPRSLDVAARLAHALHLDPYHADLLLYSINPAWVKYGTPLQVLEASEIIRCREENIPYENMYDQAVPSIIQIERDWSIIFEDNFETNHKRWGCGTKDNGYTNLERRMVEGSYRLTLDNRSATDSFMGGDSACFAPDTYYLTVRAKLLYGETEDECYALVFEEVSDECHAFLRVREKMCCASVVQTLNGGTDFGIFVNQEPAPSLRVGAENKLAILAIGKDHWFFINDTLLAHRVLPRLPSARLDVGIISGPYRRAVCRFQQFRLRVPPATRLYSGLEELVGHPVQ